MFDLPDSTAWQPLALPHAWTCRVPANGITYDVSVRRPGCQPPARGFPVIYLLDGDDLFTSVAEQLRRAARRPESTGIAPAIVVGIGHADGTGNEARRRDYTPGPCTTETVTGDCGGAQAFRTFLTDGVVPLIESTAPIDPARRALFGHSLAGYFCLHTLMSQTPAFSHFAAISPSIWWNPDVLRLQPASAGAHVYLAAGQWEDDPAPWQHKLAADPAGMARRKRRDMVGRTRQLADLMAHHWPDRSVQFDLLAGEDHATVVNPAVTRALRFMNTSPD